ncbi:MAG: DMT family transporter [Candidatus Magasanikiibacteriota bacterium]
MVWVFLAIGAHFSWAIENILTKYAVEKRFANPYVFLTLFSIVDILLIFALPFVGYQIPPLNILILLFLSGFIYFYGGLPYIKAMQLEEVSRINILWSLIPIFSLGLGYFIGDRLAWFEFIGMFILIFGSVLTSLHFNQTANTWKFSKAFWLMLIVCICYAFYGVLMRQALQQIPLIVAFVWFYIFEAMAASTILLSKKIRIEVVKTIKVISRRDIFLVCLVVLTAWGGVILNQWALSLKQTSLVFAMEGFQAIFVFLIVGLISWLAPKYIKEEWDKKNLLLKLIALIFMVAGIVVLNLA